MNPMKEALLAVMILLPLAAYLIRRELRRIRTGAVAVPEPQPVPPPEPDPDETEWLGRWWCRRYHNRPNGRPNITMPVQGKYSCLTCGREYSTREAIPETLEWVPEPVRLATESDIAKALKEGQAA